MNTPRLTINTSDEILLKKARTGNKQAVEMIIRKYQDWIFNIALTFVGDTDEAADLTQEVLIKVVTKLDTFNQKSILKTWIYRILKNHFLNMKRGKYEQNTISFEQFGQGLDSLPNESLSTDIAEVEKKVLIQEAKISCMKGMLLCLDREQRLVYIIGELFEFTDTMGSEIMEISKENFRVKLHRARTQLYNFMDNKCGLVNTENPCRCAKKTAGFIKMGYVDPSTLRFQKDAIDEINTVIEDKIIAYTEEVIPMYQELFQAHPFLKHPNRTVGLQTILNSPLVKKTFNLE